MDLRHDDFCRFIDVLRRQNPVAKGGAGALHNLTLSSHDFDGSIRFTIPRPHQLDGKISPRSLTLHNVDVEYGTFLMLPTLVNLDVSGSSFTNSAHFVHILRNCTGLESLKFNGAWFNTPAVSAMVSLVALIHLPRLQTMDLIGSDASIWLILSLVHARTLHSITLTTFTGELEGVINARSDFLRNDHVRKFVRPTCVSYRLDLSS